jgi:hypothetical protein
MAVTLRLRGGRRTNLALLVLLGSAALTGALSFAIGGSWVGWAVVAHGIAGLGIVALAPWKSAISTRGIRRRSSGAAVSLLLAVVVVTTVLTGIGHSTGLLVSLGPVSAMQVHVAAALASIPFAAWHVVARKTVPRRTDASRRNLLRSGVLLGGTAAGYVAIEGIVHGTTLPGRARRSTGSYERGSFRPDAMPVTQWLNDEVPTVDEDGWVLRIADADGNRELRYEELIAQRDSIRSAPCSTAQEGGTRSRTGRASCWRISSSGGNAPPASTSRPRRGTAGVSPPATPGGCSWRHGSAAGSSPRATAFRSALSHPADEASGGSNGSTACRSRKRRGGGSRPSRLPDGRNPLEEWKPFLPGAGRQAPHDIGLGVCR